jgi:hypothetical protein
MSVCDGQRREIERRYRGSEAEEIKRGRDRGEKH